MKNNSKHNIIFILILNIIFSTIFPVRGIANDNTPFEEFNKTVRVGYVNVPTYEEGGEGEYKTGSGYEYLQKISYFTGWQYEYVYGSFKDLYDMLMTGDIDLLGNVSYMEERTKQIKFATYPQGKDVYNLYTSKDRTELLSGNLKQLNGTTIGVTQNSYQEKLLKEWLEKNDIKAEIKGYGGYETTMAALEAGEIDVFAAAKLANSAYNYAVIINIGFSDYYFAVTNNRSDLLSELNEALYQIQNGDPNYNATLENKYQISMISDTFINAQELDWLKKHNNTIRIGYLKNNLPYSDLDNNGNFIGILNTLAETIRNDFNINVKVYPYSNSNELIEALNSEKVDVIGPAYSDYWLTEQYNLIQTNSVVSTTPVLFYKNDNEDCHTNVIAASDESFIRADAVNILFPDAEILIYDTVKSCIDAVWNGQVDSTILASSQINLMKKYSKSKQFQAAEITKQLDICLYTAKSNPELANIVNKGITSSKNMLSGMVLSQYSYIEEKYTLKDFMEDNATIVTYISVIIILLLLLIVIYMIQTTKHLKEANIKISQKQQELQEALYAAENANRAKTTFLANMSHDIRTPINGIMGMINIIENNQNNPEKVKECLLKIRTSSDHLLQLINSILDLSKMESEQIILEQIPFNLKQTVENAIEIMSDEITHANLEMISNFGNETDIWLIGSPLHFKQILLNLYTNSIKFNKPGGFLCTNLEIQNRTEKNLTLKLTIKDSGIGMKQEFMEKELFEPFVQAENGPRTNFKGVGLGMSIIKNIVNAMNGNITVESELGKGTTFTLLLPFEIDHSIHKEKENEENFNTDIKGTRILLVEDNELNMEIAEFILTNMGAIVTKAENGHQAVNIFANSKPKSFDIILMDIMMPVMNGLEATKAIRNLDRTDAKNVAIFAMTANVFSEDIKKSQLAGMNEHISKPLEPEKLALLISKYVKKQKNKSN